MLKKALMQKSGLSKDTIRHYEQLGLLQAKRMENGYLDYSDSALERIELVKHAKRLGMSLKQIAALIEPWEQGSIPIEQKRAIFKRQICKVEQQITALQQTRQYLQAKLETLDE